MARKTNWLKKLKKASGASNMQRKASRKLGVRLSRTGCAVAAGSLAVIASLMAAAIAR